MAVAQTIPVIWDGTLARLPVGWADSLVRRRGRLRSRRRPEHWLRWRSPSAQYTSGRQPA
ncbi:MAG: hypothetical protein R2844_17045 [Caldilineales bacterium]